MKTSAFTLVPYKLCYYYTSLKHAHLVNEDLLVIHSYHRLNDSIKLTFCPVHPSIHPSIFFSFIWGQVAGAAVRAGTPRLPSPQTLPLAPPGGSQGVPRPAE